MSERFEQVRDEIYYYPNGTMREGKKAEFLKNGVPADEIARMEERAKERIKRRAIYRESRVAPSTVHDRLVERAGLTLQEALTEGVLAIEGIE